MTVAVLSPIVARERVRVRGTVQGVGFRPFVWRLASELSLSRRLSPVRGTRSIGKKDLVHNSYLPKMEVDSETHHHNESDKEGDKNIAQLLIEQVEFANVLVVNKVKHETFAQFVHFLTAYHCCR